MDEREKIQAHRAKLRAEFKGLFNRVAEILFDADPVGINFEHNTDEYEPEVATILPRLRSCSSAADVQRVIHEEFVRWFGGESAGAARNYSEVAGRVWAEWLKFEPQDPSRAGDRDAATEPMMIDCDKHGRLVSGVVCRHLLDLSTEAARGFIENSSDPHDLQAWCYDCEAFYEKEGDLTDAFREFIDFAVVCVACYADIKAHHSRPE